MKVIVVCVAGIFVIGITLHRHMKPATTDGNNQQHVQKVQRRDSSNSSVGRGPLLWQDEFDFLDYSKWQHMITGWRGSQSFQVLTHIFYFVFKYFV